MSAERKRGLYIIYKGNKRRVRVGNVVVFVVMSLLCMYVGLLIIQFFNVLMRLPK